MTSPTRIAALRYAMIATGIIFIGGLYTLSRVWPSGWSWGMGYSHHWPMVLGVYATLGACLIVASRAAGQPKPRLVHCLIERGPPAGHGWRGCHRPGRSRSPRG